MVPSLGQEDPLEKERATHSSTLAWKIPWMEERSRLQSVVGYSAWGLKESDMTERLHFTSLLINRSISSSTIWLSVRYNLCTFMASFNYLPFFKK